MNNKTLYQVYRWISEDQLFMVYKVLINKMETDLHNNVQSLTILLIQNIILS